MSSIWPVWKLKLDTPFLEGGLRLNGHVKSAREDYPLISYVTVVRNNEKTLERTIKSVQAQTYKNVEHLIIDGRSTDGTLDIILKYKEEIDYFASELDNGLYDALNKAIPLCNGNLILVLNSDDWLSEESAEYAAKNYLRNKAQLISGTAKVIVNGTETILWTPQKITKNSYLSVANLNHNAVYASKEAYELSGPYDSSYLIAADTKWLLSCYDTGMSIKYTNEVLVNFSLGGISSDIYWHMEECKRIIKEKFKFLKGDEVVALHYIFYQWREGFKYQLELFDPQEELHNITSKYSDKTELIEAIKSGDFELSIAQHKAVMKTRNSRVTKIKKIISKFPTLYNILKKIYQFSSSRGK